MLLVFDHGRNLSRNERRLVWISVVDFVKVLPFAALLVAPGGSIIAPFVARVFPSMLPSTFKVPASGSAEEDLDNSSNKAREPTIKESQLGGKEEGEKARARFDHDGSMSGRRAALRARGEAAKEMYETRRAEMHARGVAAKEMYNIRRAEMHARGEAAKEILNSKSRESRVAISALEVASRIWISKARAQGGDQKVQVKRELIISFSFLNSA